jgi:hypothetical protein
MGVLMPFMTIHMKSLGITVGETAIVNGIVPPFTILAPSIMGMIADKLGNFKVSIATDDAIITNFHFIYFTTGFVKHFVCAFGRGGDAFFAYPDGKIYRRLSSQHFTGRWLFVCSIK